jgi:tetratricopeptide (TPR) repeat protein
MKEVAMQDNAISPKRGKGSSSTNEDMNTGASEKKYLKLILEKILKSELKKPLLEYFYSSSSENFEIIKSKIKQLLDIRVLLLNKGAFAHSETVLAKLSLLAAVVAERGCPEQQEQVNFLVIVKQALSDLRKLNRVWSLEELALIAVKWDEWLLSSLPDCFRVNSYHSARPESLSGLLACLLIHQAVGQSGEYGTLVRALRASGIDLLQSKGKRVYLKAWLDEIYSKKADFDWAAHRAVQDRQWGTVFSLAEIDSLFEHDRPLLVELSDIEKLERQFEALKAIDHLKRPEEKDLGRILLQMEAIGDAFAARVVPTENKYWRERIMNGLIFYNGILYTLKNPLSQMDIKYQDSVLQRVIQKIKQLELALLKGVKAQRQEKHPWEKSSRYQKQLEEYRRESRAELLVLLTEQPNSDEKRLERAKKLDLFSHKIVDFIKGFMGQLVESSIADLGAVPCGYAFIGFGSFEKRSMTPYSDLEFGILIAEDSKGIQEYFRNLSYVLHAKVIQLGETPIPQSLFDYSFDHLTGTGFGFDLGGKISLGRCYGEKERKDPGKDYGQLKYELIGTPKQLIRFVEDNYFEVDKLLPVELSECAHIWGKARLTAQYHALLTDRFRQQDQEGRLFCQHRAITYLQGNAYLIGDLDEYTPKLDGAKDGMLYDVKKEIYRLPDRLISDLALFFGIFSGSTMGKIDQLVKNNVITTKNGVHLKIMDGIARELRLSTYFHYGRQREHLSIVKLLFKDEDVLFRLDNLQIVERFYRSAYPFRQRMKAFCEAWDKAPGNALAILKNQDFQDSSIDMRIKIARRLGQHEKVQTLLERVLKGHSRAQDCVILRELGESCMTSGNPKRAVTYFTQGLKIAADRGGANHLKVASFLGELGAAYGALGESSHAVQLLEEALAVQKRGFREGHVVLVATLTNLGTAYKALENREKAVEMLLEAFAILKRDFGENHANVAVTLANLGCAYGAIGEREKAVKLLEQALAIQEEAFGADHVEVAAILTNLANAYGAVLGDLRKQVRLQERALTIMVGAFGADHYSLLSTLTNLGSAYGALGDREKAMQLLKRALEIEEKVFRPGHPKMVSTLVNLGITYGTLGEWEKAKQLEERALAIEERAFGKCHFVLVNTLKNMAIANKALGNRQEQKEQLERVLALEKQAFGEGHVKLVPTLRDLGVAYGALGDRQKQLELLKRALAIQEASEEDPLEVGLALAYLGNAYGDLEDWNEQVRLGLRALAIFEQAQAFVGDKVSATVINLGMAEILMNLGNAFGALGESGKALQLQQRAVAIQEECCEMNSCKWAQALTNLGYSSMREGDDLTNSKKYLERALLIYELSINKDDTDRAITLLYLGLVYGALGNSDKKTQFLELALELQQSKIAAIDPQLVVTLLALDRAPQDRGLLERALKWQKRLGPHPLVTLIEKAIYALPHVTAVTVKETTESDSNVNLSGAAVPTEAYFVDTQASLLAESGLFNLRNNSASDKSENIENSSVVENEDQFASSTLK